MKNDWLGKDLENNHEWKKRQKISTSAIPARNLAKGIFLTLLGIVVIYLSYV